MEKPTHDMVPGDQRLLSELQPLQDLHVIEFVEHDERPTFLIDLVDMDSTGCSEMGILYCNASLRNAREVFQYLILDQKDGKESADFCRFKTWFMTPPTSRMPTNKYVYAGITWTVSTLRQRFRFVRSSVSITGSRLSTLLRHIEETAGPGMESAKTTPRRLATTDAEFDDVLPRLVGTQLLSRNLESQPTDIDASMELDDQTLHVDDFMDQDPQPKPAKFIFDWTRLQASDSLPPHIKFARSLDWTRTPLGPIAEWPADLRSISNLVMANPSPAALFWGPQFVIIYNKAYLSFAGRKHPELMGSCFMEVWPEIWHRYKPAFESALESGYATMNQEDQVFIDRNGFLEEIFFSWSIVPVIGSEGKVVGFYNPILENTRKRVNERRMLMLQKIGRTTASAVSMTGFWSEAQKGLANNKHDMSIALIYSAEKSTKGRALSSRTAGKFYSPRLALQGSFGIPENHPAALSRLDIRNSQDGFAPYMRQSMAEGGVPIVLSEEKNTLPAQLRNSGDYSNTFVVFPITSGTNRETAVGFIVIGVNPRRPYDKDYQLFTYLISQQLSRSMASVILFNDVTIYGQKAAYLVASARRRLLTQLYLCTRDAIDKECMFTKMAEFLPMGVFITDWSGRIIYCNDTWRQITRHSGCDHSLGGWINNVRDEDRPALDQAWERLIRAKTKISIEFRFKSCQKSDENMIDQWILLNASPGGNRENELDLVFGYFADITLQRGARMMQIEFRENAVDMQRQKEALIDIMGHEIRNPLSAVLQYANWMSNNIKGFHSYSSKKDTTNLLQGCLDAINTINLCADHQKRIADDILELPRLDPNLLTVNPIGGEPIEVTQRTLKIFELELVAHDIKFDFHVNESFEKYGIGRVRYDPLRLRQILINLVTNCIKRTQDCKTRAIHVRLGASKYMSEATKGGISYFDRANYQQTATMDINNINKWGGGEEIYLYCIVDDTGRDLTEDDMVLLSCGYKAATPRSRAQCGDLGLGLFIARMLTEMHGGQFGAALPCGVGNSLGFYIQCLRSL